MGNDLKEASWVFALGVFVAVLWYIFWVRPNDTVMTNIMECMEDDRSREKYDECRKLVLLDGGKL
jgi:hypothetical protein